MAASGPRRARKRRAPARLSRIAAASLLAAGALAGCGGGAAATSTVASRKQLVVTSPALSAKGNMPALYTCAGKDISPPVSWGAIPPGTRELALFLLNLAHTQQVGGSGGGLKARLTVGWAVRHISPTIHALAAGRLPAGTITGQGRYSICPPKGGTGEYMFRLYALPGKLTPPPHTSDLELFRAINRVNSAAGYFISSYTRG